VRSRQGKGRTAGARGLDGRDRKGLEDENTRCYLCCHCTLRPLQVGAWTEYSHDCPGMFAGPPTSPHSSRNTVTTGPNNKENVGSDRMQSLRAVGWISSSEVRALARACTRQSPIGYGDARQKSFARPLNATLLGNSIAATDARTEHFRSRDCNLHRGLFLRLMSRFERLRLSDRFLACARPTKCSPKRSIVASCSNGRPDSRPSIRYIRPKRHSPPIPERFFPQVFQPDQLQSDLLAVVSLL
jgi:hypothetical protein